MQTLAHTSIPLSRTPLDPLQFAYRASKSVDDAISLALQTTLEHLDKRDTYVKMLFNDYSSAFNIILPTKLVSKLGDLGLGSSICTWILDFLTGRPQVVRIGNKTSSTLVINTGTPQGCCLSLRLYSLYTHDCTAKQSSNRIIKFADDTTVIGLISSNDESAYRQGVSDLALWCQDNNLALNVNKMKELYLSRFKLYLNLVYIYLTKSVDCSVYLI
ncbi:hypothetical protein SKAU_G00021780 [Synaphobranchus kaupii]|uniref:Reverse transcriptase domain-containing protein n=1 Tax=Synaphobranchus kaupii TaxID=118154 RepID=A0A9Q1GD87_SYNKA|nr:hypothetical protein SKAU_G00021780 [Synaphobranchus kaupii]